MNDCNHFFFDVMDSLPVLEGRCILEKGYLMSVEWLRTSMQFNAIKATLDSLLCSIHELRNNSRKLIFLQGVGRLVWCLRSSLGLLYSSHQSMYTYWKEQRVEFNSITQYKPFWELTSSGKSLKWSWMMKSIQCRNKLHKRMHFWPRPKSAFTPMHQVNAPLQPN